MDQDPTGEEPVGDIEADLAALDRIETELADVDVVLACIERAERTRCDVCTAAAADGSLEHRVALQLCSVNATAVTG